jgi:outer membrane receptor protein involved in Fe transport
MDGVPMQNSGSAFQLNNIPVSVAERIEVYKGVVPIEFGADAIGGVINIVTNQTTNSFLDASYSYGSFNTHRTNIAVGHTTKTGFSFQLNAYQTYSDNSYKIKARLFDFDQSKLNRDTLWYKRFHGAYHNEAIVAKVGWVNKPWADRFFVGTTLSQDHREIQNSAANIQIVYGEPTSSKSTLQPNIEYYKRNLFVDGLTARMSGNYNFNNNHTVDTASYTYNWLGQSQLNRSKGEMGGASLSDFKNSNYATTANLSYRITEKHSVSVNNTYNGSQRKITSTAPEEELSGYEKMRRISTKNVLGLSYIYRHNRNWNINVFGKNYYQYSKGPFNAGDEAHTDWQERETSFSTSGYGLATTYFWKDYQFKTSIEQAYRLPTERELFGDEVEEQANSELRPENSFNYNLGVTLNRDLNGNGTLYVDINGYHRYVKDYIVREIKPRTGQLFSTNHGKARNIGVDAEVRYYYKNKAMIGGTVTYMDLRDKEPSRESGGTATNGHYNDRMRNIPYFFGNADAAYYIHDLGGKGNVLNLNYGINFVEKFYLEWESLGDPNLKNTYKRQLSHDFSATYSIKNGRYNFTLEGKNLTDAELADNFGMLKPGRAIYGKIRYYLMKRK